MAAGPGGTLGDEIYPAEGIVHAGSFPGIDVLRDRDVMTGRPSQLPGRLLAPDAGRRMMTVLYKHIHLAYPGPSHPRHRHEGHLSSACTVLPISLGPPGRAR